MENYEPTIYEPRNVEPVLEDSKGEGEVERLKNRQKCTEECRYPFKLIINVSRVISQPCLQSILLLKISSFCCLLKTRN